MSRLPPLNALRVFETTARLRSFTQAARELGVTQGAVSKQVRQLEEHFGLVLIDRSTRRLALTSAGEALLPAIQEGFGLIEQVSSQLRNDKGKLSIKVDRTFAERWLMPRLDEIKALMPSTTLSITAADEAGDFAIQGYDAAIFSALQDRPDEILYPELAAPVCAANLSDAIRATNLSALRTYPLLSSRPNAADWRAWARSNELALPEERLREASIYENQEVAIAAAIEGKGLLLVNLYLVQNEISKGHLQRLTNLPSANLPGLGWREAPASRSKIELPHFKRALKDALQAAS